MKMLVLEVVIQNWDHLNIKTISASLIGDFNREIPQYVNTIEEFIDRLSSISKK